MTRTELREWKRDLYPFYAKDANAVAVTSTSSAIVWTLIRPITPCALVGVTRADIIAAQRLLAGDEVSSGRLFHDRVKAFVPSIQNLSWDSILRLRGDKCLDAFRKWLWSASSRSKRGRGTHPVDELWKAVDEIMPNLKGEVVEGFVSNVPLPLPVNPIGLILTGK
jgi:hypothetical protein